MPWGTPDVYYSPEDFALEQIAQLDYSSGSYEFDFRVVWKHESGALYTARDSGCSCPSPFEDYTSLEQLERVDMAFLESEVMENVRKPRDDHAYWDYGITFSEGREFLRKVKEAL